MLFVYYELATTARRVSILKSKQWKDHLLTSGLPLEYTVRQMLANITVGHPTEFHYERVNEAGISTQFSVDLTASHINLNSNLFFSFFIECKYRHDSVQWVFTPEHFEEARRPAFSDLFLVLDKLSHSRLDMDVFEAYPEAYPLCGKGMELTVDSFNPKSIQQAVDQLRFAMVFPVVDSLINQADKALGSESPIFVLPPIIVTTAQLWRVQDGCTIEQVKGAAALDEIATSLDVLLVHYPPTKQLRDHTKMELIRGFTVDQKSRIDEQMAGVGFHGFDFFVDHFSSYFPSLFLVVRLERLQPVLQTVLSFFARSELVIEQRCNAIEKEAATGGEVQE
jgi:hypothetical protein